jgi:hypothetical protein
MFDHIQHVDSFVNSRERTASHDVVLEDILCEGVGTVLVSLL